MSHVISVVVPTYAPNQGRLEKVFAGLAAQSLDQSQWDCVVVDNHSPSAVVLPLEFLERGFKVVRENRPGLSWARLRGIEESTANLIVFCDDDNILQSDYLEKAVDEMSAHPRVGVAGGKSLPIYETEPPAWYSEGIAPIGCQDFGDEAHLFSQEDFAFNRRYPENAPIGAGMVLRKESIQSWTRTVGRSGISDRSGSSLSSAGDCDIVLHVLSSGWDVAYWPGLVLRHLIPRERLTCKYLSRISRCAFRDFVKVLKLHGISPWPPISRWSIPLRAFKAWIKLRAWSGPVSRIQWESALGQYAGRAEIGKIEIGKG